MTCFETVFRLMPRSGDPPSGIPPHASRERGPAFRLVSPSLPFPPGDGGLAARGEYIGWLSFGDGNGPTFNAGTAQMPLKQNSLLHPGSTTWIVAGREQMQAPEGLRGVHAGQVRKRTARPRPNPKNMRAQTRELSATISERGDWPKTDLFRGFPLKLAEACCGTAPTVFCAQFRQKGWRTRLGGGVHANVIWTALSTMPHGSTRAR